MGEKMSDERHNSNDDLFTNAEIYSDDITMEVPPEQPLDPVKEHPVHINRRRRENKWGDEEALQLGETMRKAREDAGLELVDVIEDTRIHKQHLEALEAGNREEMPPTVYIIAMIRKLGALYHMEQEEINELIAPLRKTNFEEVPKDLEKSTAFEPSEENRRLLRLITFFIAAVVILIVIALSATLLTWWIRRDKNQVQYPPFAAEQLLELQPKPQLKLPPAP